MYFPHVLDRNLPKLLKLYQTDMSLVQIAKQLHVSLTTLKSKIRELGLKREPRLKRKTINEKLFKELVKLGALDTDIAHKLHISVSTVVKRKKQLGLFIKDEEKALRSKKAATCRAYYKKTGTRPECPFSKNILEKHKKTIIPLLENGIQKTKIATQYGVSPSTVYNFIHLYDLDVPQKKIWNGKEQIIKENFGAGKSLDDISKTLNCHIGTTCRAVKSMKLTRNPRNVKKKSTLNNQEEKIKALYYQGVPGTGIANKLGVSSTSMYACLKRMHVDESQRQAVKRCTPFSKCDKELIKLRQKGVSLRKIAEHFGVHKSTIFYRLKKLSSENMGYLNT